MREVKVHSMWRGMAMAAVAVVGLAGTALAGPIEAGDTFNVSGGGTIRGGGFAITSTTTPKAFDDFMTFCIEVAQSISVPGGPYRVEALATETSTGTALSGGAAYLYTAFATGTLGGYTSAKQDALQAALWKFQGYGSFVISGTQTVNDWFAGSADAQAFYGLAGAQHWHANHIIGNVRVMQNVHATTQKAQQDFLMLQSVPEPATLLLLGAGLLGAAARRRRGAPAGR